jgi:hypothetical protein
MSEAMKHFGYADPYRKARERESIIRKDIRSMGKIPVRSRINDIAQFLQYETSMHYHPVMTNSQLASIVLSDFNKLLL